MVKNKWEAFWRFFFRNGRKPERLERVADYMIGRINRGVPLKDVVAEEYVRRNASKDEVAAIVEDIRIVTAARDKMRASLADHPRRPRGATLKPVPG